jgi:hypothetical protein
MDLDNQLYLENIAERVNYYNQARKHGIRYIIENNIVENPLIINILLMTAVWSAHQREEILTDDEIQIFFGLATAQGDNSFNMIELHPEHQELTLNEILEMTVERYR